MLKKFIKLIVICIIALFSFMNYTIHAGEDMNAYTYNYLTLKNINDKKIKTVILKCNENDEIYNDKNIIYDLEKKEVAQPKHNSSTEKKQSFRDLRYDYTWNINFYDNENMVTLGSDYGSYYYEWVIQFSDNTEKIINIDDFKKNRFDCTDITYDLNTNIITNDLENKLIAEKEKEYKAKIKLFSTISIVFILFIIIIFVIKKKRKI